MTTWTERLPARFQQEINLLAKFAPRAQVSFVDGHVVVEETVRWATSGRTYRIAVVADLNHPVVAPMAFLVRPAISGPHMYTDGHLCLTSPGETGVSTSLLVTRNWALDWIRCHAEEAHR